MFILSLIECPELVSEFMEEISTIKLSNDRILVLKEEILQFVIANKVKNDQSVLLQNHLKESGYSEIIKSLEKSSSQKKYLNMLGAVNPNDVKIKFRNILEEYKKHRLINDIEDAKLSYYENATDLNEKKIYELKRQLDDLNYRETAIYGKPQHIDKKFDKWYEENKLRLERKD